MTAGAGGESSLPWPGLPRHTRVARLASGLHETLAAASRPVAGAGAGAGRRQRSLVSHLPVTRDLNNPGLDAGLLPLPAHVLVVAVEAAEGVAAVGEVAALPGGAVWVGRDDGDGDRHAGLQEVDHLLVGESAHRVFTDLHQPAALSQPGLPGVAEVLHLRDEAVVLDVEAQLAQLVPPQTELLTGGPGTDGLQPGRDLVQVLRLPVLDVDDDALALEILK